MKYTFILALLLSFFLTGCRHMMDVSTLPSSSQVNETSILHGEKPGANTLIVFAAASLSEVFREIGNLFEINHPGVRILYNFAGSQTLSSQLAECAVADIFASANHAEMDKLVAANLAEAETVVDFALNQMLVILPATNPGNVQSLQELGRPGIKVVLADATVPAGKYARETLDKMSLDPFFGESFLENVHRNIVSNEIDVKQVVFKVQLGEADAGIVYASDAVAVPDLVRIEIPANLNINARYPITVLTNSPQPGLAAEFITLVLSPEGQSRLDKWGFLPLNP